MLHCNMIYDAIAKETAVSFQPIQGFEGAAIEPERALNIGVGVAAAPLWAAFYATAGLGAAWWWSTAWTRAVPSFDVEKLLTPEPTPAAEAYIEALDDAVCDLIETSESNVEEAVEETVGAAEAIEESLELAQDSAIENLRHAQDTAIEHLRDAQDEIQEAALEARAEAAAAPLAFAAAPELVADPATVEPTVEPTAEPVAEKPEFKPSKKKAPKAEA